jgi:vitamin B12 transporter
LDVRCSPVKPACFHSIVAIPVRRELFTTGMKKAVLYINNYIGLLPVFFTMLLCLISSINLFAQVDITKKLKEVKVQSALIPQLQLIVPSQSISSNEFIRYNALNVADAIRDFSGVIIKDYGGIGGLKTASIRGLGANHNAILYNGVQINDAENGQVDLSKLNLTNVQQITLYNGQPPDILQTARAFASASVLSIETIKPHLSAEKPYVITAGVKAGSFGLVNPYLQWQQKVSDSWAFILSAYTENANGSYKYLLNDGAAIIQQTRRGSDIAAQQIEGALYWSNADSKFNFRVNYYNSDRGLPGPVILHTLPPIGQRLYNRDMFMQAGYQHDWKSGIQLLINSKLSQNQLHYFDPQFPSSSGILDQHYSQREYYQSAALAYHIRPNWEVSYAVDLAVNNMNADLANFKYPTRVTLLNVLASNLILGNLTVQGSLLNTNISETVKTGTTAPNRNIYSPTLMATFKPLVDKNFQIRGFYKYIFRLPTFNDQYYGFVSNNGLKPEFTRQYDLGIAYKKSLSGLLDYVALTADAYYNNVTNKLVSIPSLSNGYTQNLGKVDIKALDAGVKTQAKIGLGYNLSLSANYSYQQALNVTDPTTSTYLNQLPYIPQNTVALNAGLSKGTVGLYYNQIISSHRYFDNNNDSNDYLPTYAVSDISAVYKGLLNHFPITLSAEVNNLFNKSYVVIQSYPMPGRSYRFSFQITI